MKHRWHPPTVAIAVIAALLLQRASRGADAPFEKEIAAFEAADRKAPPPRDAVLFVGSSTIRMWTTLAGDFPKLKVINRGFGGSQIADSVRYADRIITPYHPSRVVLYAGDNDLAAGKTPQQVLADFKALVEKVRVAQGDVPVTFISIKPSIARWKLIDQIREANRLVETYARSQKGVDFIDISPAMLGADGKPRPELFRPDGLHMTRAGYEAWTKIISPRLAADEPGKDGNAK